MSSKVANYVALACIFLSGAIYLFYTNQIPFQPTGTTLGPKYFPNALGIILIVLCLLAAFREWRAQNYEIAISHRREIAATVCLTIFYLVAWKYIGYFYVVTALFFFSLVLSFSERRFQPRFVGMVALLAASFSVIVYVFFGLLLDARFY